jgi:DnaJ-domain-containing protein 1
MSSEIADPYSVLGISRTATADDLKRAYRRLSKAWHPDQHATESDGQRAEADRRFKLINAAYVAVGEILRTKEESDTAAAQAAVNERSDARVEAIRSVVASAALRLIPNVPRHTYRRIVSVVEALLIDTIAVGERAFSGGFDQAVREAMVFAGLGYDSGPDTLKVLDAAADDLQWRGRGADPGTWQTLLTPLNRAMHPASASSAARVEAAPIPDQLLHQDVTLRAAQIALTILFILLVLPMVPLHSLARVVCMLVVLAALVYITFGMSHT